MPNEDIKAHYQELTMWKQGECDIPSKGATKLLQFPHVVRGGVPCCYLNNTCDTCTKEIAALRFVCNKLMMPGSTEGSDARCEEPGIVRRGDKVRCDNHAYELGRESFPGLKF